VVVTREEGSDLVISSPQAGVVQKKAANGQINFIQVRKLRERNEFFIFRVEMIYL